MRDKVIKTMGDEKEMKQIKLFTDMIGGLKWWRQFIDFMDYETD